MTLSVEDKPVLDVLPVGMQDCALVLKDDDGNDVLTELQEFSGGSDASLSPAAINIENSSDVIIGPVTQFNGPVTIYQNVAGNGVPRSIAENGSATNHINGNGKLVKSESTSSDSPPQTSEKSKKIFTYSKHLKYIGIGALVLIVVAVVATAAILSLKNEDSKPPHGKPTKSPDPSKPPINHDGRTTGAPDDGDDDDTLRPAGPGAIITKKEWGGQPALKWNTSLALEHPIPFVIIMHTVTPQCTDFDECSARVQSIQNYHVGSGKSPDIRYNFLVGGDGNAYVGRGWDMRNSEKDKSIGIAFIGNYVYHSLTPGMINITQKLLEIGVEKGKLAENYKLLAHNQTSATESPGAHVYDVIKTWPHFDPKRYI